jgi:hypothetical protein
VPHRGEAPGLQRALQKLGLSLKPASSSRSTPQSWLQKLQSRTLAISANSAVMGPDGWGSGLQHLALPEPLFSPVVLVLSRRCSQQVVLQHTTHQLQVRLASRGQDITEVLQPVCKKYLGR